MKKFFLFIFFILLTIKLIAKTIVPIVTNQGTSKLASVEVLALDARLIELKIINTTDDVIEIDWNGSSIDGEKLLVRGLTRYEEPNGDVSNSVIAPYDEIKKKVCSVSQIYWDWDYKLNRITVPAKIVIKLKNSSKNEYLIFTVTY